MILDISDSEFKTIFKDEQFFLPMKWDGSDFIKTLDNLFNAYLQAIDNRAINEQYHRDHGISVDKKQLTNICREIRVAVKHYLDGFPAKAYNSFNSAMNKLMIKPLKTYYKSVFDQFDSSNDPLSLFRVTEVPDIMPYPRSRIFHTPYTMRSKVPTCRYSIAGYPSLYLATSLQLCCEEVHIDPYQRFALAARFQMEREVHKSNANISVIELAIKPQDFIEEENREHNRKFYADLLSNVSTRSAYLLWYPLIAASSFIRVSKKDPFSAEYIIPQLLMQWVRNQTYNSKRNKGKNEINELIGIRYFSCASIRASDMGFNYVFPTSGEKVSGDVPFCLVLSKVFMLTTPVYIHDYASIFDCEYHLKCDKKLKLI